jgi:hypothetical protein
MMTGRPSMARNRPSKSARWNGSSFARHSSTPPDRPCQDHPLHDRQALRLEEHVLGAAEADALGAVGRARRASAG